jgi:hypothetical protein
VCPNALAPKYYPQETGTPFTQVSQPKALVLLYGKSVTLVVNFLTVLDSKILTPFKVP